MKEPTEEQSVKLWKWCGCTVRPSEDYQYYHSLYNPDGDHIMSAIKIQPCHYPTIDLNNLFKWAVPKLQNKGEVISLIAYECSGFACRIARVFTTTGAHTISENKDPALALFWAIWKVIEEACNATREEQ